MLGINVAVYGGSYGLIACFGSDEEWAHVCLGRRTGRCTFEKWGRGSTLRLRRRTGAGTVSVLFLLNAILGFGFRVWVSGAESDEMVRKIKRSMLQSPVILVGRQRTRLEDRPVEVSLLRPQESAFNRAQKVALGLLLGPAGMILISGLVSWTWALIVIGAFMIVPVGAAVWVVLLRSKMVWKATWYDDRVEVEDGRYGATQHWVEPFSAFRALTQEVAREPKTGKIGPGRARYGLYLAHPDSFKSVLLCTGDRPFSEEPEIVAYYEQQLGKKFDKS